MAVRRRSLGLKHWRLRSLALAVAAAQIACSPIAWGQEVDSPSATARSTGAEPQASPPVEEISLPLIERSPFDRITLDAANDNTVIEVDLLDLPDRRVPSPLPAEGKLEFHRLKDPSFLYQAPWESVAKIELYEDLVRSEADRQLAANDFDGAFQTLVFLRKNYPALPGLEDLLQRALWREASKLFADKKPTDAMPVLAALAERNPQFARLTSAVEAVANSLIQTPIGEGDYTTARQRLTSIESSFAALDLPALDVWRRRFQRDAERQLVRARAALADKQYSQARTAVNAALAIDPASAGARQVWKDIQAAAPELRVGVFQRGGEAASRRLLDWASVRTGPLVDPRLVALIDFGAEGGVYRSRWVDLASDDVKLDTTLRLTAAGRQVRLAPNALALRLAELAAGGEDGDASLASALRRVDLVDGAQVVAAWRRRVLRPEALLAVSLDGLASAKQRQSGPQFQVTDANDREVVFSTAHSNRPTEDSVQTVVEHVQIDEEAAVAVLVRGDVDVVDRVPPWQVEKIRAIPDLVVEQYRLPTVHVLIPNMARPLMAMREVRRALCYAIDRQRIVRETICAGSPPAGFRPLSGPFVAGVSQGDPAGYGYDQTIEAWPYEPRLAMVLASVSRNALAKRDAGAKGKEAVAEKRPKADAPKPSKPLTIVHAADPLARAACQAIQANLTLAGVPVKLVESTDGSPADPVVRAKYDLAYVEIAPWEPLVDARKLLGRGGLAATDDPLMDDALDALDRAETWNDARAALKQLHALVRQNLPVIPLWQTVNSFAYRKELAGVGRRPVTLYQNVERWKKSLD